MKAKDIKESIYNKLVSLDYSRKENDLISVNSINWFDLDPELKEVILTFPNYLVSFDVDLMDIEDLDREQQFYLFLSEGNVYLVDTQGYTYPRYIVELEGFDDSSNEDPFEMMSGLIRISDEQIFTMTVKSLIYDLREEGFHQEDIETLLQVLLVKAIQTTK
jgi:hypothetical protein